MKREKIRCYRDYAWAGDVANNEVYYLAAEGRAWELATCTHCGELFFLDREDPAIGKRSLSDIAGGESCPGCGTELRLTIARYPQTFLAPNGQLGSFHPSGRIPKDSDSSIRDLWRLG
jgi:hypothetical protein